MKKFLSMAVLASTFLLTNTVFAEMKIAIVNVPAVLQEMPESKAVRQSLEREFEPKVKALEAQRDKATEAAQKLKKDGMTMSASEKTKLSNIMKDFEENFQSYTVEYRKRENEEANKLMDKVLDKIEGAINSIAKKDKYDLILRTEVVLYATESVDITNQVLEQAKK